MPVNHPNASPRVVTDLATERCATIAHIALYYRSAGHLAADAASREDVDADHGKYCSVCCWTRTSCSESSYRLVCDLCNVSE